MTILRYRVIVGLDYPTSAAILRRLMEGENIPFPERKMRRAEPGEIVSDIPASSVPALIEKGYIEAVKAAESGEGVSDV